MGVLAPTCTALAEVVDAVPSWACRPRMAASGGLGAGEVPAVAVPAAGPPAVSVTAVAPLVAMTGMTVAVGITSGLPATSRMASAAGDSTCSGCRGFMGPAFHCRMLFEESATLCLSRLNCLLTMTNTACQCAARACSGQHCQRTENRKGNSMCPCSRTRREGDAEGGRAGVGGHPQHVAVWHDVLADVAGGPRAHQLHLARAEAVHCAAGAPDPGH